MKSGPLVSEGYHIHFYCAPEQFELCDEVRTNLLDSIPGIGGAGPVRKKPVGPHPLPMFEAWFSGELLDPVVRWAMANRRGLSVMIHPLSGDDYNDHAQHSFWLGKSFPLNLEIF